MQLFISLRSAFTDGLAAIRHAENIRCPLEVNFHGENAEDLGGPRREFLGAVIKDISEHPLDQDGKLISKPEALARHQYFYAGLFIGKFLF